MKRSILTLILSLSLIIGVSLVAFMAPLTLEWNLGAEPPTLDPSLATDTTSVDVVEQLFLGLTDFDDETMAVIPELATSWEVSEDG
ncbi:MAG: peptide ABC transporter substrate-binding protein, partial [Atribacterota bacterium]